MDVYLLHFPLPPVSVETWADALADMVEAGLTRTVGISNCGPDQARRALENERVTLVAHESGYIHTIYEHATLDERAYARFGARLARFLKAPLTAELLASQDCILIATDHTAYDYDFLVRNARLVVDTRNATRNVKEGREKIVKA